MYNHDFNKVLSSLESLQSQVLIAVCGTSTVFFFITLAESTGEQELWCEECDDGNGWCDYPENVDCGDRPICDENDENCEMQPTEAPTPCDEVPCGDSTEYIELGPCEECYCECSGGNVYYLCCADGLFYNPDTELCDWDYNNPGCD